MPQFKFQYGDAIIEDGFFLARPDGRRDVTGYQDIEGEFFRHLSTFPDRSTIKECVLEQIDNARRHILFCNFLLQDDDVIDALLVASKRLRLPP